MSPSDRQRFIPELLEIHADELAFLWGQRRAALHDIRYTLGSFQGLSERVEAHVAGLLAVPSALPAFLDRRLAEAQDRDDVFASSYGLLRWGDPAMVAKVAGLFAEARGPRLVGLRDALGFAPVLGSALAVQAMLRHREPEGAVAAAAVLAHQRLLDPLDVRFCALLVVDDPAVCEQAWRVAAFVDGGSAAKGAPVPERPYAHAANRPEPGVRTAALGAALWGGQPGAMAGLRKRVAAGDHPAALGWLAAVGVADDLPLVLSAVADLQPPANRPMVLARMGHPQVLRHLDAWMRDSDVALSAAAGEAFTRVTGADVRGPRAALPVADDADEIEREFAPTAFRPDLAAVQAHLSSHGSTLNQGVRWNRGLDVSGPLTAAIERRIDLPSRWDACLRSAVIGSAVAAPPPVV